LFGKQANWEKGRENDGNVCKFEDIICSINRGVLIRSMKKRGIRKRLVEKVEEMLREAIE